MMNRCFFFLIALLAASCSNHNALKDHVRSQLEFSRGRVDALLEDIEKTGRADTVLQWRAGAGRAPIGWQLMHIAASEDGMASGMIGKEPVTSAAFSTEFRSFKELPQTIPPFAEVRRYLTESRTALLRAVDRFDSPLEQKPTPDARFDYGTAFKIIQWHEPHHHGQAHATFNLYKGGGE
ncbi:MAG: DinB family protein [Spirochaetales bacterium]|nr:DinB family protein [Spirochaetales bacterium]